MRGVLSAVRRKGRWRAPTGQDLQDIGAAQGRGRLRCNRKCVRRTPAAILSRDNQERTSVKDEIKQITYQHTHGDQLLTPIEQRWFISTTTTRRPQHMDKPAIIVASEPPM
jgi:hypothetical protein